MHKERDLFPYPSYQQMGKVAGPIYRGHVERLITSVTTEYKPHLIGPIHQYRADRPIGRWDATLLEKLKDRLVAPAHTRQHKSIRRTSSTNVITLLKWLEKSNPEDLRPNHLCPNLLCRDCREYHPVEPLPKELVPIT